LHLSLRGPIASCFALTDSKQVRSPGRISGPEGGSLTVQCGYDSGWERYVKWWCKGADWNSCKIMVRTTGSEDEQRSDRVSIRDSHRNHMITVTMDSLRAGDADTYWCGIEKAGTDLGAHVVVAINKGKISVLSIVFIERLLCAEHCTKRFKDTVRVCMCSHVWGCEHACL
uniref:Immunoglobulin domain-containing protein n=1 Tax=Ornithorhynchus anatinus TaxID=9258 RepID=F7D8W3_ORNAN